jgi:nicotinamidase-related amidase
VTRELTRTGWVASTTPYAWPWDGRLDPDRLALLLVCQRGATALDAGAQSLVGAAVERSIPVVHVSTGSPAGAALGLRLPGAPPTLEVRAHGWDGFFQSGLDGELRRRGRDQLLLAGDCLETGVHSTLRSANDRGYECLLVADACAPLDPALAAASLSMVEMSGGIFGAVGQTAPLLLALEALQEGTT